jgi:hypothetical protein
MPITESRRYNKKRIEIYFPSELQRSENVFFSFAVKSHFIGSIIRV